MSRPILPSTCMLSSVVDLRAVPRRHVHSFASPTGIGMQQCSNEGAHKGVPQGDLPDEHETASQMVQVIPFPLPARLQAANKDGLGGSNEHHLEHHSRYSAVHQQICSPSTTPFPLTTLNHRQ